jgi:hypothetical protein
VIIPIKKAHKSSAYPGSGKTDIILLDSGNDWEQAWLQVKSTPTLAGASSTPALSMLGDGLGILTKVELTAGSQEPLWSLSGHQLRKIAEHHRGCRLRRSVNLGDAATANPPLIDCVPLNFLADRVGSPYDSMLRTAGVKNLTLRLTYGTFTDINSAASAFTTNPTVDVYMVEREPTAAFRPRWLKKVIANQKAITAASTQFRFDVDPGPNYRRFYITTRNAANTIDDASIITNLKLVMDGYEYFNLPWRVISDAGDYNADNGPDHIDTATFGLIRTNGEVSVNYIDAATAVVDILTDGDLANCLPSRNAGSFYFEAVTTAAGTMNVVAESYTPKD